MLTSSGCGYTWWESYRYNKKQPYDLYALYELLEAREAGLIFNKDTLGGLEYDSTLVYNYLYVGHNIHMDESDLTSLLNFVEKGNKGFLFTKNLPEDLNYHFFGPECFYGFDNNQKNLLESVYQDTIDLFLKNPHLLKTDSVSLSWVYNYKPTMHSWLHVPDYWLCDPGFGNEVLGTMDSGLINFVRLRYGQGELFLHTNPELFTNYFLSDSSRYDYALGVFSYLSDGPVIWDEYVRNYQPPASQRNGNSYSPNGGRNLLNENHALRYILEQPSLALAWYIFMIGGFLYVIFRGKRRQRIIPYRTQPENSSRQFVETIGRLTREHGNHSRLAKREVKMLRQHLQERFKIHWPEGSELPDDLAIRTGLDTDVVDHAIKQIRFVSRRDYIEEGDLLRFYRSIYPLYQA